MFRPRIAARPMALKQQFLVLGIHFSVAFFQTHPQIWMYDFSLAAKTQLEKMQVFQNKVLRRFVKATRYVRKGVIHNDLKMKSIFHKIKKINY